MNDLQKHINQSVADFMHRYHAHGLECGGPSRPTRSWRSTFPRQTRLFYTPFIWPAGQSITQPPAERASVRFMCGRIQWEVEHPSSSESRNMATNVRTWPRHTGRSREERVVQEDRQAFRGKSVFNMQERSQSRDLPRQWRLPLRQPPLKSGRFEPDPLEYGRHSQGPSWRSFRWSSSMEYQGACQTAFRAACLEGVVRPVPNNIKGLLDQAPDFTSTLQE